MSDQLNPPAYVDRWWPVQKKWNDRERHHHPDDRPIDRCNLDHPIPGAEEVTDPAQSQNEKQENGGPTKGDSDMHENAEQGCRRAAFERPLAEQRGSDSLKEARHG